MTARGAAGLHGGPDALGVPVHDFSSNGNACGPCPPVRAALRRADAAHYPDPAYTALRERLGAFHGVAPARIVLGASASELIARLSAAVAQAGLAAARPAPVWLPPQAYGDYARAAAAWGLVPCDDPREAQLAWCCDPSSPAGAPQAGLAELAWLAGEPGGPAVVLDLAYEPLRLEGHLALDMAARDRLWQLWTPNKALGLTGVRAAYAIAPLDADADADSLAARLARLAPSWPVGSHGVALLDAWCTPAVQDWLAMSRERLRRWKVRQLALCESLGWVCRPSVANFFCARPPIEAIAPLLAALRADGIKLRDTTSFGLPGEVRLAVLPPASQEALRRAWRQRSAM